MTRQLLPGIRYVDHAAFTVPDLDEAVRFFVEVLGAEELYRSRRGPDPDFMPENFDVPSDAVLELSMLRLPPNLNIELFEWHTQDQRLEHPRHSDRGGHHLCFVVDDVDVAVAHLRTIPGVRVLGERKEVGSDSPYVAGNRWVYFVTPWGLLMELVDRSRVSNPPRFVGPADWAEGGSDDHASGSTLADPRRSARAADHPLTPERTFELPPAKRSESGRTCTSPKEQLAMIINTFSYLWSRSAVDAIEELVEHGYSTFEIPVSSPHCWPDEISEADCARMESLLGSSGASIRSLNAGGYDLNLASPAASMRRKSIEHITAVIELASRWGAAEVVISPGTRRPMISPPLGKVYEWMYESVDMLLPRAAEAGVRLLMENTPYCFTPRIEDLAEVVRTVGSANLGIVYDVANAAYIEEDPVAALREFHELIGLVHISDTGTDVWGHDPIGTGVVDFVGLGEAVRETCGVENVVLEIIREEQPLLEFRRAIRDLCERGWPLEGWPRPQV